MENGGSEENTEENGGSEENTVENGGLKKIPGRMGV